MQQFKDGTFGPIEPASELLARLAEQAPEALKAVHFGTVDELEKVRNPPSPALIVDAPPVDYDYMRRQMDDLTRRINELTMQHHTAGVRVYPESALHRVETARKV